MNVEIYHVKPGDESFDDFHLRNWIDLDHREATVLRLEQHVRQVADLLPTSDRHYRSTHDVLDALQLQVDPVDDARDTMFNTM